MDLRLGKDNTKLNFIYGFMNRMDSSKVRIKFIVGRMAGSMCNSYITEDDFARSPNRSSVWKS